MEEEIPPPCVYVRVGRRHRDSRGMWWGRGPTGPALPPSSLVENGAETGLFGGMINLFLIQERHHFSPPHARAKEGWENVGRSLSGLSHLFLFISLFSTVVPRYPDLLYTPVTLGYGYSGPTARVVGPSRSVGQELKEKSKRTEGERRWKVAIMTQVSTRWIISAASTLDTALVSWNIIELDYSSSPAPALPPLGGSLVSPGISTIQSHSITDWTRLDGRVDGRKDKVTGHSRFSLPCEPVRKCYLLSWDILPPFPLFPFPLTQHYRTVRYEFEIIHVRTTNVLQSLGNIWNKVSSLHFSVQTHICSR